MENTYFDKQIDLSIYDCPINFARAKIILDKLPKNSVLKAKIKPDFETFESFSSSIISEGYSFVNLIESENFIELFIKT